MRRTHLHVVGSALRGSYTYFYSLTGREQEQSRAGISNAGGRGEDGCTRGAVCDGLVDADVLIGRGTRSDGTASG